MSDRCWIAGACGTVDAQLEHAPRTSSLLLTAPSDTLLCTGKRRPHLAYCRVPLGISGPFFPRQLLPERCIRLTLLYVSLHDLSHARADAAAATRWLMLLTDPIMQFDNSAYARVCHQLSQCVFYQVIRSQIPIQTVTSQPCTRWPPPLVHKGVGIVLGFFLISYWLSLVAGEMSNTADEPTKSLYSNVCSGF